LRSGPRHCGQSAAMAKEEHARRTTSSAAGRDMPIGSKRVGPLAARTICRRRTLIRKGLTITMREGQGIIE